MNRLLAALVVGILSLAACSVPTDEQATPLDPESLPPALTPGFTAPTTTEPRQTNKFTIYLLTDRPDIDQRAVIAVQRDLEVGSRLEDVLGTLFDVDEAAAETGLVSALITGLHRISGATVDGDMATVDIVKLDATTGDLADDQTIGRDVLQDIAAQLVWTTTAFDDNIERVKIQVNGEDISIPTPESLTNVGDPVTQKDYEIYDILFEFEEPTTPSTDSSDTTPE